MSGTTIDRASDRAFRVDLNAHLEAERASEIRAELLDEQAKDLTQPGQEFYPWTFAHFEEAMENSPHGYRALLFATVAAAVGLDLKDDNSNHMALCSIRQMVEKYWLKCALHHVREK